MKAYIGNVDWADEGDVFFFGVESEENLEAMKDLIEILVELDSFHSINMYWGSNEFFEFEADDLLGFINRAVDISEEELAVLNKFRVSGFSIYESILDEIHDLIWELDCDVAQENLDRIKPLYTKLYNQKSWYKAPKWLNGKKRHK